MARHVDGFVLPVSERNSEKYRPRIAKLGPAAMPFDARRMIHAGFEARVDL